MKNSLFRDLSLPIQQTMFYEKSPKEIRLFADKEVKYKRVLEEWDIGEGEEFERDSYIAWLNHEIIDIACDDFISQLSLLADTNKLLSGLLIKIRPTIMGLPESTSVNKKHYQYSGFYYPTDNSNVDCDITRELQLITTKTPNEIVSIFCSKIHKFLQYIIAQTQNGLSMDKRSALLADFYTRNNQITTTVVANILGRKEQIFTDNEKIYVTYSRILYLFHSSYANYLSYREKLTVVENAIFMKKLIELENKYDTYPKGDLQVNLFIALYLEYILGLVFRFGYMERQEDYALKENLKLKGKILAGSTTPFKMPKQ